MKMKLALVCLALCVTISMGQNYYWPDQPVLYHNPTYLNDERANFYAHPFFENQIRLRTANQRRPVYSGGNAFDFHPAIRAPVNNLNYVKPQRINQEPAHLAVPSPQVYDNFEEDDSVNIPNSVNSALAAPKIPIVAANPSGDAAERLFFSAVLGTPLFTQRTIYTFTGTLIQTFTSVATTYCTPANQFAEGATASQCAGRKKRGLADLLVDLDAEEMSPTQVQAVEPSVAVVQSNAERKERGVELMSSKDDTEDDIESNDPDSERKKRQLLIIRRLLVTTLTTELTSYTSVTRVTTVSVTLGAENALSCLVPGGIVC